MKKIHPLLLSFTLIFATCNDREDYFASSVKNVSVTLESPLTACTSTYPGFINLDYVFNLRLTPEYAKADPLPLVARYTCESANSFELSLGNKRYSPSDTIMFKSMFKNMMLNVSKPGTYRFLIQFFKENKQDEILGRNEFSFVIGTPDLNMYIVRNGNRVKNLDETPNFLEYEGSFIVRVNSEKENLNKGRLTLTTNIIGSSVQVKNWKDKEAKISQSDDLPQTIDFEVQYKNKQVGKTKFVFTVQSQNSSAVLRDSMYVQEGKSGSLTMNTTYHEYENYYSRPQLWAGQTDSVAYQIHPDPQAISDAYRLKFEMKDPAKLRLFNTGKPEKQLANNAYEPNKWYNFTDKMEGKLYYVFSALTNYSDTVLISLQNGESGKIMKYRMFVSCKQTEDYNFEVSFKPSLEDGYDVIKYSEIQERLLKNNVILNVTDQNPYNRFDYKFNYIGTNNRQNQLAHAFQKNNIEFDYPLVDSWLANEYGYIQGKTKIFAVRCLENPTSNDYVGIFNWDYTVKRVSDNKTKTVTRKIKIIDDRLSFGFELSPLNTSRREYVYINEPHTMYRIIYCEPSPKSSEYSVRFTSTNEGIADVYLLNNDASFRKAGYNQDNAAPASHNQQQTDFGISSGSIQIKGKKEGKADITFIVKHISTNTEKSFTKTIEVKNDPVTYSVTPSNPVDKYGKVITAPAFGSNIHVFKPCGFILKVNSNAKYSGNTSGKAKIKFNIITTNQHTVYLNNTYTNGSIIDIEYDREYEFQFSDNPSGGWSQSGINALIKCDIDVISATTEETQITTKITDKINYRIVAYGGTNIKIVDFVYFIGGYDWYMNETWGTQQKVPCSITYTKDSKKGQLPMEFESVKIDFTFSGETEEFYVPSSIKSQSLPTLRFPTGHNSHVVEIQDNWGQYATTWEINAYTHPK